MQLTFTYKYETQIRRFSANLKEYILIMVVF